MADEAEGKGNGKNEPLSESERVHGIAATAAKLGAATAKAVSEFSIDIVGGVAKVRAADGTEISYRRPNVIMRALFRLRYSDFMADPLGPARLKYALRNQREPGVMDRLLVGDWPMEEILKAGCEMDAEEGDTYVLGYHAVLTLIAEVGKKKAQGVQAIPLPE